MSAPHIFVRRVARVFACALAMTLAACVQAPKPLYHWGNYQRQVYEHLKADGTTPLEQMSQLKAQEAKAAGAGEALPPGFRAHMGMLHLKMGSLKEARDMLEAEKRAFPESAPYMDFLIKRVDGQKS